MNAALLAALINEIAVPELTRWLRAKHADGQIVDDAAILQKLLSDTNFGIAIGEAWLRDHPAP